MGREDASYVADNIKVRRLRNQKGLSQQQLAALAVEFGDELAYSTIRKLERKLDSEGQQIKVSADTLKSAAKHLLGDQEKWQELLSTEERQRLGLQSINDVAFTSTNLTISAVPDFTGRTKELADIATHLQSGNAVCITAIKAAGGMGKTQLARRSAEELVARFPDGTLLLELDGMTSPKSSLQLMKDVITKLNPGTGQLPDTIAELQPIYLTALGTKKLLLVLDNAADAAQVAPLLKELPKSVGVIITSRKLISLPNVKRIDLEVMSPTDAVKLLDGIVTQTRSDITAADLLAIAVLCGHLPLALRVAGTLLRDDRKWTRLKFEKALHDDPLHHLTLGTDEYHVDAVLRLSVQQIVQHNAEQAERFQMLCVFPGTFAEEAAASVWSLDEDETFTDLDELHNRSLIEWDEKANRYRLHDLMRPVARDAFPTDHPLQAGADERIALAERRHAEHYVKVFRAANDGLLTVGLATYDLEVANIAAGRAWADAHAANDPNAAKQFMRYSLNGSQLYDYRLSPAERVALYERCLEVSLQTKDHEAEAKVKLHLGDALVTLGDVDRSLTLYREAADLHQQRGDVRSKAVTMGKIADILAQRGQTDEALRNLEAIKIIFHDLGDVRSKAVTMGKIADILRQRGQTDEALRIRREEELPVYERLGDVHSQMICRAKIGMALLQKPSPTEAEVKEGREHLLWALATAEKHQYAEASQLRETVAQLFGPA